MKKEEILKNIFTNICEGYVESLLTGVEEYPKDFPYTIASANFINELKERNIKVDFFTIFDDLVVDMVFRETSNYLAR